MKISTVCSRNVQIFLHLCYNSLGKYQIQGRRKEQLYTKDKTALNVILSDCTRLRTFSQYVYGGSIFHS